MDERLIRDARAVKRRRLNFPTLWLFTDSARLPDPLPAIARLPRGIAGVVFRHDDAADRLGLGRKIARLCRARRIPLVVAGDARLAAALGAGLHLRNGRRPPLRMMRPLTASAHDPASLRRATRAGAGLVFLSPAFPTVSHPGLPALGAVRWVAAARRSRVPVLALGGMKGASLRALGKYCAGVGAIGALTSGQ
jgi:thiamine-phosphate pyrophosphorylase